MVLPANVGEPNTARESLLPHAAPGSIIVADTNYDSRYLDEVAHEHGSLFIAPIRGNRATTRSRTTPRRRRRVEMWERHPKLMEKVYRHRTIIERLFSVLVCTGEGLGELPTWVRGLPRVNLWVTAKIAIHNARFLWRQRTMA